MKARLIGKAHEWTVFLGPGIAEILGLTTGAKPFEISAARQRPITASGRHEYRGYTASYLVMVDIARSSLVWALPIYFPGNPNNFTDTPEGAATLNPGTNRNPVIATASSYSGAYFIGFH